MRPARSRVSRLEKFNGAVPQAHSAGGQHRFRSPPAERRCRELGRVRQTVLNPVRAGKRDAVEVVDGKRPGLRIDANGDHDTLC